jgi:hypothetical protein
MSCVNTNSPEFKSLTQGMDNRQRFVARAIISRYMTQNNNKLPSFIELKSDMSDLYNTNQGGVDYKNFYNEVKSIFKSLLPGISDSEIEQRVQFVDKLELMRLRDGKEVLSSFINNTVYIANSLLQERGTEAYTDVKHEVFHVIFNNFLSDREQQDMVESFKKWKPQFAEIMDKEELEERMADTFEDYRTNPKKTIPILVRDFFQQILKFLGLIGNHYNDIKALFDDVENGKFTRNYLRDSLVTRDKTILSKYNEFSTNLDLFLQSKAFVMNNLNELMNPEVNKILSEKDNNSLFLTQDDYPGLFQNNKETFKLGLTKNDALKQLQKRVKALKDSKSLDPQLTNVVNVLSKTYILKDLFDYLQPFSLAKVNSNGELVLKDQIEEDPDTEINLEESDEQINSLEIGSKELINPTTKISEVVKDFLSSITYETTPGNFVAIDPGVGFISLLNMLGTMYGNTSIQDNLSSLEEAYSGLVKGNQTKAVFEKLKELHNEVIGYNRISLNIKSIPASELTKLKNSLLDNNIKFEEFKNTLTVLIPNNMKIENQGTNNVDNEVVFTFNRFAEGEKSFLIRQKPNESNKTFVEKVSNETGVPNFIISKLFRYNEQRNQLAEVTKVANSLRKLSPKFVKVQTSQLQDEETGERASITSYAFINKVSEFRNATSLASVLRDRLDIIPIRKNIVNLTKSYSTIKDSKNREDIRSLLKSIVVKELGLLSESDFEKIKNKDAQALMGTLEKVINFVPEIQGTDLSANFKNSDIFLRHTSKFASSLTNYTIEKNNPTSFGVSTSNKQKWENVMSNTSFKIFNNLQRFANKEIKFSNLLPFLKDSFSNYLKYNPLLNQDYNDSTFTVNEDLLKVREDDFYADHQETYFENKNSNFDKPPVPFSKESPRDWINRNFLAMFQIPILEDLSKKKDYSYFQQKFQPESAPNVSVVKMGINSSQGITDGFKHMIIQEAYMQYLGSKSTRKNIKNNTSKSLLPGLEGSTYFIREGENIFFNDNGELNPQYGKIINGKLEINPNNDELKRLTGNILQSLDTSMDAFIDTIIEEKATLDGTAIGNMYEKIKDSYLTEYQLSSEEMNLLRNIGIDDKTDVESIVSAENWQESRAALKKAMSSFYLNSYVNGYFMNQLSSGSTQNYKNPLDEIKRQAGVNAMNDTGLIDDRHGMKNSYKNIVIAAANNFYGESHRFANIPLLQRFFRNKEQEIGDAQSWDLPEYKQMLKKSFGKSVDIGVITKDVHFEINNDGYVDYRKTSSAELTNELVRNNKTLRDLRYELTFRQYLGSLSAEERQEKEPRIDYLYNTLVDQGSLRNVDDYMEYQDLIQEIQDKDMMIHKASFESAIKGSKPAKMSQFIKNNETNTFDFQIEDNSILNLNSTYTGIQQAIRHRYIDSFISHFTQLTYLIGLNRTDTSIKNNKIITRTLSKFAKSGIFDSLFDYRMSYGEDKLLRVNPRSKSEFINDLIKKLDLPGNERIVALLRTPRISMNNPLFSEKLMQSFFSSLTKKTVAPKHPGGSFVLQSEFGFEANQVLQENSLRKPELVTDESGNILYAECYLPEMYSQQIQAGSLIYYNSDEYNKMFGFRIPSSDLHSSVPLKVIGYYPTPVKNGVASNDNVVVIPSAVTALHGSDFDVDKLFVVRYGVFGQDDEDIDPKAADQNPEQQNVKREYKTRFQTDNTTIAQKGIKYGYTAPEAQYNDKGNLTSFGPSDKHVQVFNIDNVILDEKQKTQDRIIEIEKDRAERDKVVPQSKGEDARKRAMRTQLTKELDSLNKHLKTLRTIQKGLYSNQILDAVLDNISYSGENAEDILFGITFDPVKGYEETSEYSELARVFSDINKANGVDDLLPERPKLYKNLNEAKEGDPVLYTKVQQNLQKNLGINTESKEGQTDWLSLINDTLQSNWVTDRDEFIKRQSATVNNINKVEQHMQIHKDTYMAAGLVGLIANFSKGLAYAFHGITDDQKSIELQISEDQNVVIDGQTFNKLTLSNKNGIKNQELRSLTLNAAIDHVKEQILNVLNVGNKTAKIFLAAISTEMNLHQATMVLLQPVAKELNSSNATTVAATLNNMAEMIETRLNELQKPISQEDLNTTEITTKGLEKFIKMSFTEIFNDTENPSYRKNLIIQRKIIQQLGTLNSIGNEVSEISQSLSIIQGLPYNLEQAYDKLKVMSKFINIDKFYDKLSYSEKSEYTQPKFKDDLRSNKNILKNVNLANNENILGALEAIKTQIDVVSEIFTENSIQAQFIVNNMLKAVSNNSDPSTMYTGENDQPLTFDTTKNFSIQDKYLKGKNTFNVFKLISRNIFNYLTSGLNVSYNDDQHLWSLAIKDQPLYTLTTKKGDTFQFGAVKSYINAFLMQEGEIYDNTKNYNGDNFVVSQINPEWRIKPLSLIKRQNQDNKFLRGLGIDTNFRDNVRIMTFNSSLVNTAENLAEVEQAVNELNNLKNIYVRLDKKGRWVDVPSSLHPETTEMNEVTFNILKSSLYIDKFKFSSSKATNVLPPIYFQKIFLSLETLVKDLIYYDVNPEGNKYYKDFTDLTNQTNESSAIENIKENMFINTIFSVPTVLPNLKSLLPNVNNRWKMVNRQAGVLSNGNIYDMYFDANILDKQTQEETQGEKTTDNIEKTDENTNLEVDQDVAETTAENDLFETFRKNPSFIVNEDQDRAGNFEIYMKVGSTGSKEDNDLKYYYKKVGNVNGKMTNNSFDLNLLLNKYKINEYFNPKRFSIPVKEQDFSGEKVTLSNIKVSSFLVTAKDDLRTKNQNRQQVKQAQDQLFEELRQKPENKNKTDQQLLSEIKTKVNVGNVLNEINEVSLYDSRSLDRVGMRHFKILSREISSDNSTITLELEALPRGEQINFLKFDAPLDILKTVRDKKPLTREEKIAYINSIPGAKIITNSSAQELTNAQINQEYEKAQELDETKEVNEVIKNKSCK